MSSYYQTHSLNIDSAETPYLYYQVYDWVGTRYKYAGKTKKGIDCSGFAGTMYKQVFCIDLNGGSKDIYKQIKPIESMELKEGDLLFFKIKKGQISHVGVYLGNNKFAHASVHSGVIISDLNEPYYKKHFFTAGRLNS
ncbi:MAG: C40 family peptidase [Bacteroidia bacterium]|nr:C40 family peptidase [Bacteroidia bacterium]